MLETDLLDDSVPTRRERFAGWLLRWPLACVVGFMCLWEYLTWAPNYLTWPLWADHDVFATAATSWNQGVLPYRDFWGNNFPGTIYLFWIFGKVFGFGWALGPSMYGFDAMLVAVFGVTLLTWSFKRFSTALPGLIGYGGFLGYYLALDYSQAAQRDWQGPAFVVLGLMAAQIGNGGRTSRWSSAILAAIGLIIRPQAILLLPAIGIALAIEAHKRERSVLLSWLEWGVVLSVGVAIGFFPLYWSGLLGDFRTSLKVVAYGAKYNRVTPVMFAQQFLTQLQPLRVDIVPLAIFLLAPAATPRARSAAWPWMVALLGVLFYRPLSPNAHLYLTHPLMVVWSGLAAVLVQMTLDRRELSSSARLVIVLLIIGLGLTAKPRFSNPKGSLEAFGYLRAKTEPQPKPTGYARNYDVPAAAYYEWQDYSALLDYIRKNTSASVKIANCLKFVPAITGPTARLSAFPAESVAWVTVVRADAAQDFAERLVQAGDCIVIWAPEEKTTAASPQMQPIFEVIESHFEPKAKFGKLEVWTRKKN